MSRTDERSVSAREHADHPQPWSPEDLRQRLDRLHPEHPSSPYNADGTRKPPPPSLRDLELPLPGDEPEDDAPTRCEPLSDAEYVEYAERTQDRLTKANDQGLATIDRLWDPVTERWTPERRRLHNELLEALYERAADVPCEHKAIMAGGLGGAGKSTVLGDHAGIDRSQYLTIDPDYIKEEMAKRGMIPEVEGLTPMEASDLVHEESSYISKLLGERAMGDGKNIIWDITMSSRASTEARLDGLDKSGYATNGIFVDIPIEESMRRASARHREGHEDYRNGTGLGGRYVPPELIRNQADPEWGSVNRRTFEEVKQRFIAWAIYDNSVYGREPVLVASAGRTTDLREQA